MLISLLYFILPPTLLRYFIPFLNSHIFRPHRSTTYVDAAYSYRPSSMVCRSVTLVSPAKTAAPMELPFGLRTWVGPGNHVLDGDPDPPWEGANFWGEWASHCKVWGHSTVVCAKTAEPIGMPFGLWVGWAVGIMCWMGVHRC